MSKFQLKQKLLSCLFSKNSTKPLLFALGMSSFTAYGQVDTLQTAPTDQEPVNTEAPAPAPVTLPTQVGLY